VPPLEVTFDGVYSLALEFRAPLIAELEAHRDLLPDLRLTVSAYRDVPDWAKITLVPTSFVESGWANVETISPVEVIARRTASNEWRAFLVGSAEFDAVTSEIPPAFFDISSALPAIEGEYLFPWRNGQSWWAIQGWHDGSAIDFQPGIGSRFGVLASQSGRLREICSDGSQSLLEIQHADGRSTYYLHVTMGLAVRRQLLDQNIQRGQYLGELLQRDYFRTPCGQGRSRHLHFVVSDRNTLIQGFPVEDIASTASCCANPPSYVSTNIRVDDSD
jgi:hypothetical protein